jgi:hypothetical protein
MTCKTSAVAVCCSSGFAGLGDEPRVLHCDDRLSREILKQSDFLIGKCPYFLAIKGYRSKQRTIFA